MPVSRVACLYVPDLPLQALLRAQPELGAAPLVLTDGTGARARVLYRSTRAAQAGIARGAQVAAARAACAEVVVVPLSEKQVQAAGAALLDVAAALSPQVELGPSFVALEVGDLGRLYPSELAIAEALTKKAAEVGLLGRTAVAASKAVARVLARTASSTRTAISVRAGCEREALAPLPLSALEPPAEILELVTMWGLRTVADFAALSRGQVTVRLGRVGEALHRLCCGEDDTPLSPTPPPTEILEEQELLDSLESLEPLLFVLRGTLDRVVSRLRALGQSCGNFELRLQLEPGAGKALDRRAIAVAAPTRDIPALLALARLALESQPPPAAVRGVAIATTPVRPRPVQLSLFSPAGPLPERLAVTLGQLGALCGEGRVGQPQLLDSHLPGACGLSPFAPPPPTMEPPTTNSSAERAGPGAAASACLAAQILRPPRPVQVERRDGALLAISALASSAAAARGDLSGPIVHASGRYRLRGEPGAPRDYFDVELASGELLRLYHELTTDRWFIDARYD